MTKPFDGKRPFTNEEAQKIIFAVRNKEQVPLLTVKQRNKLFKSIFRVLDTNDFFVVKGALWELLKYMVSHQPDTIEKWMAVRWLLHEIAMFAQEDYGQKISPDVLSVSEITTV